MLALHVLSEDYGSVSWRGPSVQAAHTAMVVSSLHYHFARLGLGHIPESGPHLLAVRVGHNLGRSLAGSTASDTR